MSDRIDDEATTATLTAASATATFRTKHTKTATRGWEYETSVTMTVPIEGEDAWTPVRIGQTMQRLLRLSDDEGRAEAARRARRDAGTEDA